MPTRYRGLDTTSNRNALLLCEGFHGQKERQQKDE
jgi:hypothetical protein